MHDVIIVGHGPAGLSAAIFAGRADLKTLVIGFSGKSQIVYAPKVKNYPGFPQGVSGKEFIKILTKQAKQWGAEFIEKEVVDIKKNKTFMLKTADNELYQARSVVIATGVPIPWTGIKNEKKLLSKGVHTCPSCDGPLYRNKKVAIIGSGNHAADDAIVLAAYTKDITIISHSSKFEFSKQNEALLKKNKIKLIDSKVKEFARNNRITAKLEKGREEFDGVFLACGSAGSTAFAEKLGVLMKGNLIIVDEDGMTNIRGVFAAGNCMSGCRQLAKNVGDGCNAGVNLIKFLKSTVTYVDYGK